MLDKCKVHKRERERGRERDRDRDRDRDKMRECYGHNGLWRGRSALCCSFWFESPNMHLCLQHFHRRLACVSSWRDTETYTQAQEKKREKKKKCVCVRESHLNEPFNHPTTEQARGPGYVFY